MNAYSALALLQEIQARDRYHDDWEVDYHALREQTARHDRWLAIKGAVRRAASWWVGLWGRTRIVGACGTLAEEARPSVPAAR